jgi:glucuronosyltransferase
VERTALIFVNTDSAIDFPEPLLPNMIQVGGLQILDSKPLPEVSSTFGSFSVWIIWFVSKAMEKFVKGGKRGTILMSLGTNIKSNMLGNDRLKVIIETFAQFPDYNFLWKFESDISELPAKPSANVMIANFLPQNDILAHSNVKAFISHSGMLSTHEGLWHGKPIVGMPFFVDQHRNIQKLINIDVATKVDFRTLTVESFKTEIEKIISDPKFFNNAQKISKLFKDKPMKPLETAIWWTEYVLRNPNMENMKSPTLKLGPFASQSFDVLLVALIILHAAVYLVIKSVKLVAKLVKAPKKNTQKKKQ